MAVKVFRLDVVPETSAQLADILTRMAAAPIKHPAVVGILDAGLEGTTAFLAMEYIAGETLDVSVRRLAPASLEVAVPLLRQVAEALEAGWMAGMGHGALHPRDIFVLPGAGESGQAVVRVSGFGIAEALEELRVPIPVRRPYTAPEREEPGPWDMRADVYSLGVIAHELLTGRRPTASMESELDAEWGGDEQRAMRSALSMALAADPQDRFERPMAFVDALTNEPIAIAPAVQYDEPLEEPTEEPLLPWASESDGGENELEPAPAYEPEEESSGEAEIEAEPAEVSTDLPPVMEPVRESRSARIGPPFFGVTPATSDRAPFQPFIETPRESAMPRYAAVAVIALLIGTGLGYWLRGPAPGAAPEVTPSPSVAKADEPIGTDVAVKPTAPSPTPTPVSAPVAAPASNRGRLLVRSVPGDATVSVNGRGSGTTPATIRDLPFGTYTVAVSRTGYQRREQRVTLTKAVPARELTIQLAAVAAAAPASPGATTGSVRIETRPLGATVAIDGRVVGTSPMRVPELSPGSHTVRLTLAGHKTVTTTVTVRAGQQALVRLSLEIQ